MSNANILLHFLKKCHFNKIFFEKNINKPIYFFTEDDQISLNSDIVIGE